MPDTLNSSPSPKDPKPRAPRGVINKGDVDALAQVRLVVDSALNPLYNAQILDDQITPQFLADLKTQEGNATTFLNSAVSGRGDGQAATGAAQTAKVALASAIQRIQSRAYQKFHGVDDERLKTTYYSGHDFSKASDALLEQIADAYLQFAPGDNLPKVDATRITALQTLVNDWNTARGAQAQQKGTPVTTLAQFKQLLPQLEAARRVIQFAADDEWPADDPVNKVAREAFALDPYAAYRPS